jgi:uncharacterized protein (DUF433 family)
VNGQERVEPAGWQERIVENPEIMAGKPTVRGTRVPVDLVLKRLSQDLDVDSLFESYPRLTEDDVKACLAYAQAQLTRAYEAAHEPGL